MPGRRPSLPGPVRWLRRGPGRFTTYEEERLPDGEREVWTARGARKRLGRALVRRGARIIRPEWRPPRRWIVLRPRVLSWWVAAGFTAGSALFVSGAAPLLLETASRGLTNTVNAIFLLGSLVFTGACVAQMVEARRAPPPAFKAPGAPRHSLGWYASAMQLAGMLVYDVGIAIAVGRTLGWDVSPILAPVAASTGAVAFVTAGHVFLLEQTDGEIVVQAHAVSWWASTLSVLGSVCFLVAGAFGLAKNANPDTLEEWVSQGTSLLGSVLFLVASLLLVAESSNSEA